MRRMLILMIRAPRESDFDGVFSLCGKSLRASLKTGISEFSPPPRIPRFATVLQGALPAERRPRAYKMYQRHFAAERQDTAGSWSVTAASGHADAVILLFRRRR